MMGLAERVCRVKLEKYLFKPAGVSKSCVALERESWSVLEGKHTTGFRTLSTAARFDSKEEYEDKRPERWKAMKRKKRLLIDAR